MKEIEKFALLAAILGVVVVIYAQITFISSAIEYNSKLAESGREAKSLWEVFVTEKLWVLLSRYISNLAAVWLYFVSKRESLSKPIWVFFGLVFGIIGVGVFYAANVYYMLKKISKPKRNAVKKT